MIRTSVSRTRRPFELLPVINHSESATVEAAVMASEIGQLPDLAGYLKLASRPQWLQVALSPPTQTRAAEPLRASAARLPPRELSSADLAARAHEGHGIE